MIIYLSQFLMLESPILRNGHESKPIVPYLGGWTSIYQFTIYFDVHQGYRVLTHSQISPGTHLGLRRVRLRRGCAIERQPRVAHVAAADAALGVTYRKGREKEGKCWKNPEFYRFLYIFNHKKWWNMGIWLWTMETLGIWTYVDSKWFKPWWKIKNVWKEKWLHHQTSRTLRRLWDAGAKRLSKQRVKPKAWGLSQRGVGVDPSFFQKIGLKRPEQIMLDS